MNKPSRGFYIAILICWMILAIIAGSMDYITLAEEFTMMIIITIGFIINDLKQP